MTPVLPLTPPAQRFRPDSALHQPLPSRIANLRSVAGSSGTIAVPDAVSRSDLDYNDLGDLDFETQTIAGGTPRMVDYGHDQAGNRNQLVYPGAEVLAYTPTVLNLVESITFDGQSSVLYDYYDISSGGPGRLLAQRRTTDGIGNTSYYQQLLYDSHRRIETIWDKVDTPSGWEDIAKYAFTHDKNGNPLGQTVSIGMEDFVTDDRAFMVDQLNRLTATEYFGSGETESSTFDLVGNRESHTNRAGETTEYGSVNQANEYASIGGLTVSYDAAGNLSVDESGRQFSYDERNRLTQIKAADETVLANYTYDALGRRIVAEFDPDHPTDAVTVRYTYDGQNVIEERDENDGRLRYHVNGAQYVDERVATYDDATVAFTYYLVDQNFSVAGKGNADGIERVEYLATGDFTPPPDGYFFDADSDTDIDLADLADFISCLLGPDVDAGAACAVHDIDRDTEVDLFDAAAFARGFTGAGGSPPGTLLRSGSYAHDGDGDRDIDLDDYSLFLSCFGSTDPGCLAVHDYDASGESNGQVQMEDEQGFQVCFAAPTGCFRDGFTGSAPASGTFALHGRPVDVLSDGHVVQYSRARYYTPAHGRWLQRDPLPYNDGPNLYEAFTNNATANTDPLGTDLIAHGMMGLEWIDDRETITIDVWSDPSGFWHTRSRKHHLAKSRFDVTRDVPSDGAPSTRSRVTLGDREYVVRLQALRQWAQATVHEDLSMITWGSVDPSDDFVAALIASSFAERLHSDVFGILDARTGMPLPGWDPDDPEMIRGSKASIEQGLQSASHMIKAGMKQTMYALATAAFAEAVVGGVQAVRGARAGTVVGGRRAVDATGRPLDSGHYSVVYEVRLQRPTHFPGKSETTHLQHANRQLHELFQANPQLAQRMESMYPGIIRGVRPGTRGAFPRRAPISDLTWHHAQEVGVLQLVRRSQHISPGPIQESLHPGGRGGMDVWGERWRRP